MNQNSEPTLRQPTTQLPQITIESPCQVDWNTMTGDEAKRFCQQCSKHVHKLSEMRTDEIADLLNSDDSVCVRLQYSTDGSLVTKENAETVDRQSEEPNTWFNQCRSNLASYRFFGPLLVKIVASIAIILNAGCTSEERQGEIGPQPMDQQQPSSDSSATTTTPPEPEQGLVIMGTVPPEEIAPQPLQGKASTKSKN